jgi:hypothetical protein
MAPIPRYERQNRLQQYVRRHRWLQRIFRVCENSVHVSTELTTNGTPIPEINYLAVHPELVEGFRSSFHTVCFSSCRAILDRDDLGGKWKA